MYGNINACTRAHSLAYLMVTTSLWPIAVHAQQANTTSELPAVEVIAEESNGTGTGVGKEGDLNTTPDSLYQTPLGQVETTIPADRMINTKAFSVFDVLRDSPGVSLKQGNGPRDVGISIRGSNARNGFGIRNIVIFEDGFPVTQPDGLSRTDLTDPHAYGAIDVIRGPSSALFGNYATGGAINFRLRSGAEIDGIDVGTDAGSFGYLNNYLAYGSKGTDYDVSLFASDVVGNGPTNHNLFNTQTVNFLGTYMPTPDDKITIKAIDNRLYGDLSVRLSLNQFYQNPYQTNCYFAAAAVPGCGTVGILRNGFFGPRTQLTAYQAGLHRNDTRSILGLRWEHNLDNNTIWRTQVVLDDKNISQPTGATSAQGDEPAINFMSDLTSLGSIFGFNTAHFAGIYLNTESNTSYTSNLRPGGNAQLGGLTQLTPSQQTNMGIRGREEIKFTNSLTGVVGLGAESTNVNGTLNTFTYPGTFIPTMKSTPANNNYYNIAPEGALVFRPDSDWLFKARIATGYGTPQASNLFVTSSGNPGNNTGLKSQTNLGYDLAAVWTPMDTVRLSVDGFYEFFRNELVSQSPGPSPLMTYTFNAPRSEHRGVEVAGEWRFYPGWKARVAYTYDNQIYTQYTEQLSGGTRTSAFNRAGHWIPGVAPNELTARIGYDVPVGPMAGLGAYAEYYLTDEYFADNGNLLKIPGYRIVNLNIHYDQDVQNSFIQKIGAYFEVRNVFDNTYIASANNITNTINTTTGGQNPGYSGVCPTTNAALSCSTNSIYAGFPRTFVGGIRVKF
ncbi:MAG TPA: TonB-dependent receptor [Methylocella sp.]|jgi:iron complex outermembrane receptor protein